MILKKILKYLIFVSFLFAIIPYSLVAVASIENIPDVEKDVLLKWVNSHCENEFSSFDALIVDRRIRCKSKKNDEVPANYYRLDGYRHVRPDPSNILPIIWIPIPFIFGFYLIIVTVNYFAGKKTNHLKHSVRLLIIALPWLAGVYAVTIYQDQFLKQNVDFIRKHGNGKVNSFLLKICSNDLFFTGNPVVYSAVDTGSLDMVKFVVEEMNFNPNQKVLDVLPIALAANHRMTDIVDYLIKYVPENPKERGRLFFKTAILLSQLEYVKEMLKHEYIKKRINNQEPGEPWISRRSALYLAVHRNEIEITRLLLENGADPNLPNSYDSKTPIDAAKQNKNVEMQKLLEEYRENEKVKIIHNPALHLTAKSPGNS